MKSLEMLSYATLAAVTVAVIAFIYPSNSAYEASDEQCLTQSPMGAILGAHLYTLFKNQRYCAYRGIRFAKAPIGDLRFKVNFFWSFVGFWTFFFSFDIKTSSNSLSTSGSGARRPMERRL